MSRLSPKVSQFIKKNFPVIRKRSALWFFTNELRKSTGAPSITSNTKQSDDAKGNDDNKTTSSSRTKPEMFNISRNKILHLWRNMDPESKRKYFNMSEFDEIRYKEQRSLWLSEVGYLLLKHGGALDKVREEAPSHQILQRDFLHSLEKIQDSYERMIQAESTKVLYKDAIKRVENFQADHKTEDLISAVPEQHRPLLAQPRRPPVPFVIYYQDNLARLKELQLKNKHKDSTVKLASKDWSKLNLENKALYENKYQRLLKEYRAAMVKYRAALDREGNSHLVDQASKEKRLFRRLIRRRLKDSAVLPLNIRNAFNFFLMENSNQRLIDLTEVWRNLPEEQKNKYVKMCQADTERYQSEIEKYREIKRSLNEFLNRKKSLKHMADEASLSDQDDDEEAELNRKNK